MNPLKEFVLPVSGLSFGVHEYQFKINSNFFKLIEGATLIDGVFDVKLFFDKRPDLFILDFEIEGFLDTDCDRCLASIELPISESFQLIVKLTNEIEEIDDDEGDIIFLSPAVDEFDVSIYIYEYIMLSIPILKKYDCELTVPRPCNMEVLNKYDQLSNAETDSVEEEPKRNKLWDVLKDFDKEDNN
ncbi:MAG: DUF177 domain-containing protein [Saprospiraceae bacterium]|nr:DUF177 domain-containing protein [Saprospiraceae bacterium]